MSRLLVYTRPTAAAAFPLVPGLLALQRRGHGIEMVTAPAHVESIAATGLTTHPVSDAVMAPGRAEQRPTSDPTATTERAESTEHAEGTDLAGHIARCRPDAILVDGRVPGAQRVAAASAITWGLIDSGDGVSALAPGGTNGARVIIAPLDDPPAAPQATSSAAPRVTSSAAPSAASSAVPLRLTGATHWDPAPRSSDWLTAPGADWILVACSGSDQDSVAFARSAVEALRDGPYRVVVTIPHAFEAAHLIPAPNIRVERFWPHRPVLERARAVICQTTPGVVSKARHAGVPVVAVPTAEAGEVLAGRLVRDGAGVELPMRRLRAKRLRRSLAAALELGSQAQRQRLRHTWNDENSEVAHRFADAVSELWADVAQP